MFLCLLVATFSSVTALQCSVELDASNTTALCDEGCDSCLFSLSSGCFQHGIAECLENVPCSVSVTSGEHCFDGSGLTTGTMYQSTIDGSQASDLSIVTSGSSQLAWHLAKIFAPGNGKNFSFLSSTLGAVIKTSFYAEDSGTVSIVIDNYDSTTSIRPELSSMDVFASTAQNLYVELKQGTEYSYYDSSIQCPASGACLWQSSGQRYTVAGVGRGLVNVILSESSEMRFDCDQNSKSCDGVVVRCQGQDAVCQLQYDDDNVWRCNGELILLADDDDADQWHCPEVAFATTTQSDDGNSSNSNHKFSTLYIVLAVVFCTVGVGGAVALGYYWWKSHYAKAENSYWTNIP